MKKLGVHRAATVGVMAVAFSSLAFLSTGVAAADDYAGQTYGDAVGAITDAGKKVVISSRSGNAPAGDNCLVTHSESAPWRKGTYFSEVTNTVLLDLNCNAKVASATQAGNSAASPEGRAALEEQKKEAAKKSSEKSSAAQSSN
jgi:hypothetical protein